MKKPKPTLMDLDREPDGQMLTTADCAALLGISERMAREMVVAQDIRSVQIGRLRKIPWRSMRAYLRKTGVLPLRAEERA